MSMRLKRTKSKEVYIYQTPDGRVVAMIEIGSVAEKFFMQGMGVIPDAHLTCADTDTVLIPHVNYTPIVPDGFDEFRRQGGEAGQ